MDNYRWELVDDINDEYYSTHIANHGDTGASRRAFAAYKDAFSARINELAPKHA